MNNEVFFSNNPFRIIRFSFDVDFFIQFEQSQGPMVPFLTSEPSSGQQGLSNIRTQNHSLPQGRSNRNCQICGDMANGFNLNVPRYVLEVFFNHTPKIRDWNISTNVIVHWALRKGWLSTEILPFLNIRTVKLQTRLINSNFLLHARLCT